MVSAEKRRVCAVILAAGSSLRFGEGNEKIKAKICGKSVLTHTVAAFEQAESISSIIVVARECDIEFARCELWQFKKVEKIIAGGACRAESAKIGALIADAELVAIHDAARCLITPKMINAVVEAAIINGAATLASAVYDTVKRVDPEQKIVETVPREQLVLATTPQVFLLRTYLDALNKSEALETVTDDNLLLEKAGVRVLAVVTDEPNLKITTKEDLKYCEFILGEREKT